MIPRFKLERIAGKGDLAKWLGWQFGGTRYLEIATAMTGHRFSLVSPAVLSTIHRAMYLLPPDYDDGLSIICRSESEDSHECLAPLLAREDRYDVIFVDSFHTYECSRREFGWGRPTSPSSTSCASDPTWITTWWTSTTGAASCVVGHREQASCRPVITGTGRRISSTAGPC
jgi:hypothetical protein